MTPKAFKRISICAALLLATASTAKAQKITDARIADLIREAAARAGVQAPGTAPGHHRPRVPTRRALPGDRNEVALARGERSGSRAGRR